ncbi:hypothetical protein MCHI_002488 [Candidatus Magnetoovum chiemensis]|nr:hypothetical protein MCHI_002488 [Candidatus Magnetoovum chiemensis]
MPLEDIVILRQSLNKQGVFLCYSGYITEDTIACLGLALKQKLVVDKTNNNIARSAFAVFVELAQNVTRYCAEIDTSAFSDNIIDLRYGILMAGAKEKNYFISCANIIQSKDVERLRLSLNHIKQLDKEGIKLLYKKALRADPHEGSKGAGLGFIEIAMRSPKELTFDFAYIDDNRSYFAINVYL